MSEQEAAPALPVPYRPGTRLRVSKEFWVVPYSQGDLSRGIIRTRDADGLDVEIAVDDPKLTIDVLPPAWRPGTLITANGTLWVVRKSNRRDSYRVMPVNLSGRNRTLPIEDFHRKYPKAVVEFEPKAGE